MSTLKIETKTVQKVDSYDFDSFVREVYGVSDYSFIAAEECGNDSSHEFIASPNDCSEDLAGWIEKDGRDWVSNHDLFDDLCFKGVIAPGTYLIDVCW